MVVASFAYTEIAVFLAKICVTGPPISCLLWVERNIKYGRFDEISECQDLTVSRKNITSSKIVSCVIVV